MELVTYRGELPTHLNWQAVSFIRALGFIGECFPGREIIGIEASDLVFEGGAIHCISQQQPRAD